MQHIWIKSLLISVSILVSAYGGYATAQTPGTLDIDFRGALISGANNNINTVAIQSDGKTIIGGFFTNYGGTIRNRIARLNSDGSLDTSLNPAAGANNSVRAISLESGGKIIIGGDFTSYSGTTRNRIARINSDGSLDTSFDPGSGANNTINVIEIQTDGKILIAGNFTSYDGVPRTRFARLNTDGSLDTTFNMGSSVNSLISDIKIQNDGKIVIVGSFTTYSGTNRNYIARINSDGSLDTSFDPGVGPNYTIDPPATYVNSLAIQSDGKIVIGGNFRSYNGVSRNYIARINSDGSLDTSFNPGGGTFDIINKVSLQTDGKILIGGNFTSYNGTSRNRFARINSDGSLDTSFDPGVGANNSFVSTLAIQSDGKAIIIGNFTSYNNGPRYNIARINTDGSLDNSFASQPGANNPITSIIVQNDGKIVIGGNFSSYNSDARNYYITRLATNGLADVTFNIGNRLNNTISELIVQNDDKIIIVGNFSSYSTVSRNRIARLNTDGSLDTSFNSVTGTNNTIDAIALQSDGKILIAGNFTTYNGITRTRIARLNADSSLDSSFNPGAGANNIIDSISIQADGKILIAGSFTSYNGTTRNRIARINADGSLDTSFNPGGGVNSNINTIHIQSGGKIMIGGNFTTYSGVIRNRIARINTDGSLDTSFNPLAGANNTILTIASQVDGKVIIGGLFTSYSGTTTNRIARINSGGSLDSGFNIGSGANNAVYSLAIQNDGNIIIAGVFTGYNGIVSNRIARIYGEPIIICLGGVGTVTFSSFGFCLQSAGQTEQVSLFDLSTNTPLVGRVINTINRVIRAPYRVAPTASSSSTGSVRYVGVPLTIPALSAESSGDVYIIPFKPIEIGTGGTIEARYDQ